VLFGGVDPQQNVDLVLVLDPTLAAVDANGDQMATWTYKRASVTAADASVLASKPLLLFRKNGPVVFTKNYVKHRLFSKKTYSQGTEGMITKIHPGPLGGVTHVNVRLANGEFVNEVPVEYFLAEPR
jgi:hypothetical protein